MHLSFPALNNTQPTSSIIPAFLSRSFILGVLIFTAYLVTAGIGLSIRPVNTFATLIWPPSGIALAALMLYGRRYWPAVALAACAANVMIGAPFLAALGIAAGNTLGPLLGSMVLKEYIGFVPPAVRLRDNLGIIGVAFAAPVLSASFGVASLWLTGVIGGNAASATWGIWWLGDALGILVCAPFLIRTVCRAGTRRTSVIHRNDVNNFPYILGRRGGT